MAFRRRFKASRRRFRFRRSKMFGKRVAKIARRTVRRLAETKFFIDNINIGIDANNAWTDQIANGLTQGTTAITRVGARIQCHRWGFDLKVAFLQGLAGVNTANCRIMVFYPRKAVSNGDVTALISPTNPGLYGRADPTQIMTLYDKFFTIGGGTAVSSGAVPTVRHFKLSRPSKYIFNYDAANTVQHCPIMYITTDIVAGGTSGVNIQGNVSVSFKDT